MKQFISNILTSIAALINPYRPDPRYEECHFWFRLCCEEFELGQQAYANGDIDQWRVHVNNHKLLSRISPSHERPGRHALNDCAVRQRQDPAVD